MNNNRSRPLLPDRPVRPVGARPPLNVNVSPKSPEGRISYEGATGIKPNETKRNETKRNETKRNETSGRAALGSLSLFSQITAHVASANGRRRADPVLVHVSGIPGARDDSLADEAKVKGQVSPYVDGALVEGVPDVMEQ